MRVVRFILLWIVITIVMTVSWGFGSVAGNVLTDSAPPEADNTAAAGAAFLFVCVFNSLMLSILFWKCASYSGWVKRLSLIAYIFGIQFLLTQMETFFFAESISISQRQVASILIAGAFMSVITGSAGLWLSTILSRRKEEELFSFQVRDWKKTVPTVSLLVLVAYPFLYMFFGYFVAWQYESLRIFYSGSAELRPFSSQVMDSFANGIYFFQILRGCIWLALSVPVVLMLRRSPVMQYLLMAVITALLPSSLLFIPNPYMPMEIAMAHFIETSISNFLWGLIIVYVINTLTSKGVIVTLRDRMCEGIKVKQH